MSYGFREITLIMNLGLRPLRAGYDRSVQPESVSLLGLGQMEGIAKAAGVYKGRPRSIDPTQIRAMREQGMGMGATTIAKTLGIDRISDQSSSNEQMPKPVELANPALSATTHQ